MSPTFTQTFGGLLVQPAQPSYAAYTSTTSLTLTWPLETAPSNNIFAALNDITMSATGLTITMDDATQTSEGTAGLFYNVGSNQFTVLGSTGATLITATSGAAWYLYLTDNSTTSGSWRTFQMGAGTSSASAATLAGLGLVAITTTLNQQYAPTSSSTTPRTLTTAERASLQVWTGGAGAWTFSALATLTSGWFVNIANQGTGALVLTPPSGTIDGAATKTLNPGDTAIIITDGTNMFTIGFGQDADFAFTYITISVAGMSGTYTLSGSELNKTAIRFTGAIIGALDIIVPSTAQQYWIDNSTTGTFTFGVRTTAQATPGVSVGNGSTRMILYCNGTDVVNADTSGLSSPVQITQGGTGATTAATARSNLDVPSVLDAFTFTQIFR